MLGLADFGRFATVMAVVGLAQTLLDLTVEEALTKFGFRYVAAEDWGRLRRLFRRALEREAGRRRVSRLVILAIAPFADTLFGTDGLDRADAPRRRSRSAPGARERLRERAPPSRPLRPARRLLCGVDGHATARDRRRARIRRHRGARRARGRARLVATAIARPAGAYRAPPVPPRRAARSRRRPARDLLLRRPVERGDRRSLAAGRRSHPLLLGIVAGTTQVGYFRVAQAPQTGFSPRARRCGSCC